MTETEMLILAINRAIPYSQQIRNWDTSEKDAIRFTWRGSRFRVGTNGHTESVGDGVLIGDNISILVQELIQKELIQIRFDNLDNERKATV